jgi:hypothetical protein
MLRTLWKATALATAAVMVWATTALADLPEFQSISLNGGAATTSSLSATANVAVKHCPPGGDLKGIEVAFRNDSGDPWTVVHAANTDWPGSDADGCTSGEPTSPTTGFSWTLASGGDGNRTVFARFKHGSDEAFAQDSIAFEAPPSDTTAPVITPNISGTLGNNGWYVSDVTVSWTVTDNESSISSNSGCDSTTINVDTAGTTLTCTATSAGGTETKSVTIKRDATPPTASVTPTPAANTFGWNNTNVTVSFSGSDGLSGIDFCDPDVLLDTEGAGQSASGTCTDRAGNVSATATASEIKIDKTNPSVSLVGGPADGASYYFGFVPAAPTCNASDALSGLDGTCSASGYGSTVGNHTVTATAKDKAGNSAADSASYTVLAWTLSGFYQPVDNGGVWNTAKGGSTVPLKFEVFAGPTELTDVAVVDKFAVKGVACPSTGYVADDIELTTTGSTSLRYDSVTGQFIQNWQTPKKAGACYEVSMFTDDGSSIAANFKLK